MGLCSDNYLSFRENSLDHVIENLCQMRVVFTDLKGKEHDIQFFPNRSYIKQRNYAE